MEKETRVVIKNIIYLLSTRGLTYVFPLLILGHLVKTLNADGFGHYAIIFSLTTYAQAIADYGFSLTSSREISKNIEKKEKVAEIYLETTTLKLLITLAIYPIYYCFCKLYFKDENIFISSQYAYTLTISGAFLPIWFFQGVEYLKIPAIMNLVGKAISLCLIFVFVKTESDLTASILAQSIPALLVAIYCNSFIFNKYIFIPINIKKSNLWESLKDGWSIFVSSMSSIILTNSAVLILGVFATTEVVGIYAAAERLAKAITSVFSPITQAIYPYNCRSFSRSKAEGLRSVRKTGWPTIALAFLCTILILICSGYLTTLINFNDNSVFILKIFSLWILLGVINNVLGIQILCASSENKIYARSFLISAILSLLLMFMLCPVIYGVGAALSVTIGEFVLTILMYQYIRRKYVVSHS